MQTEEIKLLIRKYALQSAVKYNKIPQVGAETKQSFSTLTDSFNQRSSAVHFF